MVATTCPLLNAEFIPYLLAGPDPNYDAFVSSIATCLEPISSTELLGHLLAHDVCMLHHTETSIFSNEHSTHYMTKNQPPQHD